MAKTNRLAALRKAIAGLEGTKKQRRYDERLAKEMDGLIAAIGAIDGAELAA